MSNNIERLLELKREIEEAKLELASAQGALQQNLKYLKEEFGCKSLAEAKKKLTKLTDERDDLEHKLNSAIESLEKKYEW